MSPSIIENRDTRYFVDIERETMKIIDHGFAQKQTLNGGRQMDEKLHRLYLTKGQYNKLVSRCLLE